MRHPSLRPKSLRSPAPDSFWTLNPELQKDPRWCRGARKGGLSPSKHFAVFLATLSTVSFAAAPQDATGVPAPITSADETAPAALPAPPPSTDPDSPKPIGLANLASPAGAAAAPGADAVIVESFLLGAAGEEASALFAGQAAPLDAAPVPYAAQEILAPLEQPAAKSWSGSVHAGYSYDDNPRISQGAQNQGGDSIYEAGAAMSYLLGGDGRRSQVTFNGSYAYEFYDENTDLNGDSVNTSLTGLYVWGLTSMNASASWQRSNGANRLVADEISSDTVSASLGIARELTGKIRLVGGGNYSTDLFDGDYLNSESYGLFAGGDYAVTSKTRLGLQYTAGITEQDASQQQISQGVNLTVGWNPSEKLVFNGSVGYENRTSDSPDFAGEGPGLVFAASGSWQMSPKTALTLAASRDTVASPLEANSNIYTTRVDLGVNWRFSDRVSFSSSTGYGWDDYAGSQNEDTLGSSDDNYWNLRNALNCRIAGPWAAEIFHEYQNNDSSRPDSSYDSNRFGANIHFNF